MRRTPAPAEDKPTEWLTLTQAAKVYPLSKRSFWRLIMAGRLRAFRPMPQKVLVRREDVEQMIEANQVEASGSGS